MAIPQQPKKARSRVTAEFSGTPPRIAALTPSAEGHAPPSEADQRRAQELSRAVAQRMGEVIVGKQTALAQALTIVIAGGHLLIEDIPGVGKTMLGKALARAIGTQATRIQFTPDLMPSDITGISLFNQERREFEFRPGPIFSHVVIADELNRASPKTQSALLESMEEGQVSVDGTTHRIAAPFLVIATQNPIEMDGTYLLPEAQRDRFMGRMSLGYPSLDAEAAMLKAHGRQSALARLGAAIDVADVVWLQTLAQRVTVQGSVEGYLLGLIAATREHPELQLGASPRASLHLLRASRAQALLSGRTYVTPEDVAHVAPLVLEHRLALTGSARHGGRTVTAVLGAILQATRVPSRG